MKPSPEIGYVPSAGPLAISMYKQLNRKKLHNGSTLKITVLPASVQKDVLPEIDRLQCSWVLQLWQVNPGPLSYESTVVRYEDVYFSLWNGATRKGTSQGSALFPQTRNLLSHAPKAASPAAVMAQQVLDRLNKLN